MRGNAKVFLLMAGMTALFVGLGWLFGGQTGMVLALLFAGGMNVFAYYNSDRMVLRAYRAQVVDERQAPELYAMVDRLRSRAGLPMPTLAVAPQAQPNAFATGRDPEHAVVCVTQGILSVLTREELEGVLAHELAHVKNRDMLLQTVTASIAGAISALANIAYLAAIFGGDEDNNPLVALAMMIVAPVAASVIQLAISRQREFKADAVGAEICGRPLALASALRKLEAGAHRIPMEINPAVAPVAQVNPLAARGGGVARLFSTHPPTEERVARLEAMTA